jgi:hypothetical protein
MANKTKNQQNIEPLKPNLVSAPNYGHDSKWQKAKRKLNSIILNKIANTPLQFKLYRSYWHYRLSKKSNAKAINNGEEEFRYLTQMPNYGAGIGHQMSNWNSGLYFANYFNIKYAHSPFSTERWESFFGFGEGEVQAADLKKDKRFKIIGLPTFDSGNLEEIKLIGNIISSYKQHNVLFCLGLDQGYMSQYDTSKILSDKFFKASARKNDKLTYDVNCFNIAIHIRRRMKVETSEVWENRGLENTYYSNVLQQVLELIKTDKQIKVYFFSQGDLQDFPEFEKFSNIIYCLDMGPVDSVLHMVYADLLISSKSSFSYKPALISKGIKICPETFWHGYPPTNDFILADNQGEFDNNKLLDLLNQVQVTK